MGCTRSPGESVLAAAGANAAGDREGLLSCMTSASAPLVEGFWSLGQGPAAVFDHRPGPPARVESEETRGTVATVVLREGENVTRIPLRLEDGEWRIDLLAIEKGRGGEIP